MIEGSLNGKVKSRCRKTKNQVEPGKHPILHLACSSLKYCILPECCQIVVHCMPLRFLPVAAAIPPKATVTRATTTIHSLSLQSKKSIESAHSMSHAFLASSSCRKSGGAV